MIWIKRFESVYQKYNLFFDLKTKRILKIFYFSFFNVITKIEKWMNFLKFIFWFEIKKWIREFRFLFFEIGFKSKQSQKKFFSFFFFQFNNQIWKMKDIFWNSFFHFKSKNELRNFEFYFLFFFLKWVTSKFVLIDGF